MPKLFTNINIIALCGVGLWLFGLLVDDELGEENAAEFGEELAQALLGRGEGKIPHKDRLTLGHIRA